MNTINLEALMKQYRLNKKEVAEWLYPQMDPTARTRKVERLMRGEQTLNCDELITLSVYLVVTPNDLYLTSVINPLVTAKLEHQARQIRNKVEADKIFINLKTQINENQKNSDGRV